jgi:hypothetical protein
MKKQFLICFLAVTCSLSAQDQVKVMYYNILNYPSNTPERSDTLRKIIQYVKPDLFLVNELQTNTGANLILANSLNQWGINYYQKAAFVNGPDTDNMLFYNSEKFGLVSQQVIPTVLRDINEYVLYYKDPNISASSDTIYFYMYSLHLKAGNNEAAQRNIESTTLRNFLDAKVNIENVFVGGDFNFYAESTEPGYTTIQTSTILELKDPIFASGDWHNNASYAYAHTQSTRTTDLGDGSWGGMDDRFDFIFVSDDLLSGVNGADYIPNTYKALGQDGLRFNQSINIPVNNSVPDSVSSALLYMSDHLPVIMEIDVNYTTNSIIETNLNTIQLTYASEINSLLINMSLKNFDFMLFNISGQEILNINLNEANLIELNKTLESGIYIWIIESKGKTITDKIVID